MQRKQNETKAIDAVNQSEAEAKNICEAPTCTHAALRRAARRLGNLYDDALAPLGLKATQVDLLAEIERLTRGEGEHPTLQDLAVKLAIQISAVTHALRPLIRDGLVQLRPDELDRRAKRAALTRMGATRLQEAFVHWAKANQRVEDALGKDAATLRLLAHRIASEEFLAAYSQRQAGETLKPDTVSKE